MNLPNVKNSSQFVSLFAIDFGGYSSVGFTAEEVAELLESEKYKDIKVYKIHKAYPDGTMELKGMSNEIFELEMAMLFYAYDEKTARKDYQNLLDSAAEIAPPCKTVLNLDKVNDKEFVTALIYPAEYNDEMSDWFKKIDYKTKGEVQGGIEAADTYFHIIGDVLESNRPCPENVVKSRTGEQLLNMVDEPIQRFA